MTYKEIERNISAKTGFAQKDIKKVLDAFVEVTTEGIGNGEEVYIANLGKFYSSIRTARSCINPFSGEPCECPERTMVKFKASSVLKKAVQ